MSAESDARELQAEPAWRRPHSVENLLPVAVALALAAILQMFMPERFSVVHPHWLLPALELVLLVALAVTQALPGDQDLRLFALLLLGLVAADNTANSVLLDVHIIDGSAAQKALTLLLTGASVWVTNVIVYGVWYWLLDRGGPNARAEARKAHPDFLFPQMQSPKMAPPHWRPIFLDYLYTSFTNATAFSPTDTMPLSRRAKTLMALQSIVSLVTVGLVFARAVNVLQ